jgi:hypothetical protein
LHEDEENTFKTGDMLRKWTDELKKKEHKNSGIKTYHQYV